MPPRRKPDADGASKTVKMPAKAVGRRSITVAKKTATPKKGSSKTADGKSNLVTEAAQKNTESEASSELTGTRKISSRPSIGVASRRASFLPKSVGNVLDRYRYRTDTVFLLFNGSGNC